MRTILIAAIFTAVAATASAQEITPPDDTFVSTKTRAEVIAEMHTAQAQGLMKQQGEITWLAPSATTSGANVAAIRDSARRAEIADQPNTVYGPRYRN
ncbi:MAG: DUF4148 domain-containing protein [Burkholderiaceae bacterium]|nr:DUF4148 domain-containing protein [Burkholderiaceae bacterium]